MRANSVLKLLFSAMIGSSRLIIAAANENADGGDEILSMEALHDAIEDARQLLDYKGPNFEDYKQQIQELEASYQDMQAYHQQVEEKQDRVDQLLRSANARMLEGFLKELEIVLDKEQAIRKAISNITASIQEAGLVSASGDSEERQDVSKLVPAGTVTVEAFREKFDTNELLKDSEMELSRWASNIIKQELEAYQKSMDVEKIKRQVEASKTAAEKTQDNASCMSIADSAQTVESALIQFSHDDIGMADYAKGASIVYEMTSPSYTPPPDESHLLGNVWWRKFVPEDWEKLLPSDWENWSVSIPASIYHTFSLKGSTVPAEAVLQSNRNPGSCWPMEGGNGQITLRLQTPVDLSAFTVDHVSRLQVPEGKTSSAPKKIKVIGYPPCGAGDECPLGFRAQDPAYITQLNYDLSGPTIQTFQVGSAMPPSDDIKDENDEEPEDVADQSCSATSASCSAPPHSFNNIAAITFQVVENWGNPDFTCLYRLRVHGEKSSSS